jgi:endo-1,3(4)-beta-glucanase
MYPAIGSQWSMLYTLPAVSWDPPRPVDSSCTATVLQGFYYWGGAAAAQARLALIAYVGDPSQCPQVLKKKQ